jgi:hypothetical protein
MTEKENKDFILILSDIGENSEKFEYLFRIIEAVVEMPPPGFPKEYWKFENVFSEEKTNQLADYFLMHYIINIDDIISSYKFIYKLSENELKILKEYLNKNLKRKYI